MTPPISTPHEPLARRAIFWTVAAVLLALAVHAHDGRYSVSGILFLLGAIVFAVVGTFVPRSWLETLFSYVAFPQVDLPDERWLLNVTLVGGIVVFGAVVLMPNKASSPVLGFAGGLAGCGLLAALLWRLSSWPMVKRNLFPAFLIFQAMLGFWTIAEGRYEEQTSPRFKYHVRNDVQTFAQVGASLISQGKNPYSVKMPNVMGADLPFYFQGATDKDGKLPFGYPYLPLSLLWSLPGYWLGDFRFMHVVAILGAAFFLAYARPSVTSQLAATLFLLFPSTVFILLLSWIEPVALFFLGATVFCAFRAPRYLFVALGCLLASKQYTVFLLPLLPLLVPDKAQRGALGWKAIAVAALLTLPLALWDIGGFWRSVMTIQFKQPFREDALSFLVTYLQLTGHQLSGLIGFAALFAGLVWGVLRAPRHVAGWCGAGAIAYLGFFAFNKQAFANYYFWPFGLLVGAVAIALPANPSPTVEATTPR